METIIKGKISKSRINLRMCQMDFDGCVSQIQSFLENSHLLY